MKAKPITRKPQSYWESYIREFWIHLLVAFVFGYLLVTVGLAMHGPFSAYDPIKFGVILTVISGVILWAGAY